MPMLLTIAMFILCIIGLIGACAIIGSTYIYEPTITICNINSVGSHTYALDSNTGTVYSASNPDVVMRLKEGHTYKIITFVGGYSMISANVIQKITSSDFVCNGVDNKAIVC